MIFTTWNIRGCNDPQKISVVKQLLKSHSVNIIGILETKVKSHNALKIQRKFGQHWKWVANYDCSPKGRIWVGWNDDYLKMQVLQSHEQFIHCQVGTRDNKHLVHVFVIYGLNTVLERKQLWSGVNANLDSRIPTLLAGDFNAVTNCYDRINGNQVANHETHDFLNFINQLNLIQLETKGPFYTWSSKGEGTKRVSSRIDRGFINNSWEAHYQLRDATILPPNISDHSPLLVDCFSPNKAGGRPFKFLNCVADHKDFLNTVASAWDTRVSGCYMFQVWIKLQEVKKGVKSLHSSQFGNVQDKIDCCTSELHQTQGSLATDSSNTHLQQQEQQDIINLRHWLGVQESIYRQKSRIEWLKLGDTNNKFFFSSMKHRQSRNKIEALYTDAGDCLVEPCLFEAEISKFYKDLLGTRARSLDGVDIRTMRRGPTLSENAKALLIAPVTTDQIDMALKSIKDSKAPGCDGFNALFFKKAWHIIKPGIYEAILDFFDGKPLLKQWNCTSITLVPKVDSPSSVKDYRPIACCNVIYKLISKILTNRLAAVIGEVVDAAQAGFIPGKNIADNILLATELMKGYTHKYISPRCLIKVDLKKAYDSIEWCFVKKVLEELCFPKLFVEWVMECIQTVSYSILINGVPTKPVPAQKGLRQGDPMSPFIFAIGMEYLSRCLGELKDNPCFNYHPKCEKLHITHLMFADDLLLLARADASSIQLIHQAFQKFSKASGLEANLQKSTAYFGGVPHGDIQELQQLLPIPQGIMPFTYLGVPLSHKKLTINQCKPLVEKVTNKIKSWTARFLSYAGRVQMVTSVLFGVQTYWAQIFVLPKKIIKEIETKCRIFLWTGQDSPSKKALISWDKVCLPKKAGGLNIVDVGVWNKAATLKILWNIAQKSDSLWVKWCHVYFFKHKDIWEVRIPSKCSWNMKRILKYREMIHCDDGWGPFTKNGRFLIKAAYHHIRPAAPEVSWFRILLNSKASPKSLFITWLALHNRLYTRDRMLKWNITCDPICVLCKTIYESVLHLFFECSYSNQVWQDILKLLKFNRVCQQWDSEVAWISRQSRKKQPRYQVLVMCFCEAIYLVWLQRNSKVYNNSCFSQGQIYREIIFRVSTRCNDVMRNWLIM